MEIGINTWIYDINLKFKIVFFIVKFKINFEIYIIGLVYVVICHTLVIHFSVLRDVIISCVYISNDILFLFMIAVATMDLNNAEILRFIGHLREIGSAWGVEMSSAASCQIHYYLLLIWSQDRMMRCIASHLIGREKGNSMLMAWVTMR